MKKTVNTIIVFLCLAIIATMSSCSSEQITKEKILGKWHPVKATMYAPNGEVQELTEEDVEEIVSTNWTFLSDGTLILEWQGEDHTMSWYLEDNKLVLSTGMEYFIVKITSKMMILNAELNGYTVDLQFNKVE